MTHPETAIAALFDHEQELEPAGGHDAAASEPVRGRRRPAPDWGGDDLFSSTPRRRRRLDPEQARRAAAERHRSRDVGEHHLYAVPTPEDIKWSHEGRFHRDEVGVAPAEAQPAPAPAPEPGTEPALPPAELADAGADVEFTDIAPPAGRRTVTVTGHPEPRIIRQRRPSLTVDQRIGHRPDRIAGWAFALGMVLILIAILTANMG
jgi:hypothetical protein